MKKILATVSAVALSLAMVAMPSIAMAEEVPSTDPAATEVVTTEPAPVEPVVTEPAPVEPVVTEPVVTELVVEPLAITTTEGTLSLDRTQTTVQPTDTGPTENQLCTDVTDGSYSPKVDANANDPFSVAIPDGFTLVAYCVKSGTVPVIVDDNADAPNDGTLPFVGPGNFVIDYPGVDSVSHYQLKLIETEVVDVCDNIDGNQSEVPDGKVLAENGTSCVDPVDECALNGGRFTVSIVCPDLEVEVSGTPTDQVCVESGDESVGTFTQGSIQLTISDLAGVEKIEYSKDGGSTSEVDLGGSLLIEDLAPGKYDFVVTVADGYEEVDDFSVTVKADNDPACKKQEICHWNEGQGQQGSYVVIDVSIKSIVKEDGHDSHENDIIPSFDYYEGDNLVTYPGKNLHLEVEGCGDFQFPDLPLVVPQASQDRGCELPSSFTIGNDLSDPAALSWTANGDPIAEGTHAVNSAATITLVATANGPEYGLGQGAQTEWTFTFPSDETCGDLTTLALTGSSDTTPALALTAFLGLLGLAMVRSGIRVNRRQEA